MLGTLFAPTQDPRHPGARLHPQGRRCCQGVVAQARLPGKPRHLFQGRPPLGLRHRRPDAEPGRARPAQSAQQRQPQKSELESMSSAIYPSLKGRTVLITGGGSGIGGRVGRRLREPGRGGAFHRSRRYGVVDPGGGGGHLPRLRPDPYRPPSNASLPASVRSISCSTTPPMTIATSWVTSPKPISTTVSPSTSSTCCSAPRP